MQKEAVLTGLGYVPNEALMKQLDKIEKNTVGYDKIIKHILDLHIHLRVDNSFIAMSNTNDYFKIKVEAPSPQRIEEAHEIIQHFADKFKINIEKIDNKDTYYIIGTSKSSLEEKI